MSYVGTLSDVTSIDQGSFDKTLDDLLAHNPSHLSAHLVENETLVKTRYSKGLERRSGSITTETIDKLFETWSPILERLFRSAAGLEQDQAKTSLTLRIEASDLEAYLLAVQLYQGTYCALISRSEINPAQAQFYLDQAIHITSNDSEASELVK